MALRTLFHSKADSPRDQVQVEVPKLRDAVLGALYYSPRVGGDFCDSIRVHADRVLFGLLDVAGRAKENSGIVSAVQATFRKRGAALFAKDDLNEPEAMIELCRELNNAVFQSAHGVRECPALVGCYREGLGTVCYFNAGHTPGLLRHEGRITELPATGLPLGLFSHVVWDANTVALPPGAALLLVSRGVAEAQWDGTEFGLDRVKEQFLKNKDQDAGALCKTLLAQPRNKPLSSDNDLTALALVRIA